MLSETTTEVLYEVDVVQLHLHRPFYDVRLGGPRLRAGSALQVPTWVGSEATVLMSSEQMFHETVEDLPWKPATTFFMQAVFVRELLLSGDPSAVHDGAHGFYELAFVPLAERELPTSAVAALIDVLELKERHWPKLPTEKERQRKHAKLIPLKPQVSEPTRTYHSQTSLSRDSA